MNQVKYEWPCYAMKCSSFMMYVWMWSMMMNLELVIPRVGEIQQRYDNGPWTGERSSRGMIMDLELVIPRVGEIQQRYEWWTMNWWSLRWERPSMGMNDGPWTGDPWGGKDPAVVWTKDHELVKDPAVVWTKDHELVKDPAWVWMKNHVMCVKV